MGALNSELTFPLSPGYGQTPPPQGPLYSSLAAPLLHFCCARVGGSPANLCITLFPPSFPKDLPPISFSQAINLETEMGLLLILWPLFFFLLHFVLWFFSPFSASVCLFL